MIEITNDVLFVTDRLKEIDFNYFIVYNLKRKVYEVHHKGQKDTYVLTVPFSELDERTVDFVNKTRVENRDRLLRELEIENQKLEKRGIYES